MNKLLSRDDFRNKVFDRDNQKCVVCKEPAKDAHHIIERRLFDNGGYYIDNGASLCEIHHIEAEKTLLSCDKIRELAKINNVVLPEHLYSDSELVYDKWGNIILPNGNRLKGDLFYDESVQKILKDVLHLFQEQVKHPRTMHLPWSEKVNDDDKKLNSIDNFINKEVVVSVKLDGEQTSMGKNYIHARSIDSNNHPTRNWVKNLWSKISQDIPDGWRICGENLYGQHTIPYKNLDSYFYVHSIWNEKNICLNYDETVMWVNLLELHIVPTLYKGIFDIETIKKLYQQFYNENRMEGYVVRISEQFKYQDFKKSVAKFVGKDFTIKHGHWTSNIQKNLLKL